MCVCVCVCVCVHFNDAIYKYVYYKDVAAIVPQIDKTFLLSGYS